MCIIIYYIHLCLTLMLYGSPAFHHDIETAEKNIFQENV